MIASTLLPSDEAARLQALNQYRHLSTLGEPLFETLVSLTARLFATPVALVSLVEEATVFFAGNVGLPGAERVAREQSLCSVAVLHNETTVFEDLTARPCDLVDPSVSRAHNLAFYAGHPLRTPEGYAVGSLCVMDHVARSFSPEEQGLLIFLAEVVVHVLALRAALRQDPERAQLFWTGLEARIAPSLTRIQTLIELGSWEETPDTLEAKSYQISRLEEAALVVQTLDTEVRAALTQLA